MTQPEGYSTAQIVLHWLIAVLVAAQYLFHDAISLAWEAISRGKDFAVEPLILAHVAGGGLILLMVVWRLALRLRRGAPSAPDNEPMPLKILSHVVHWVFYALLTAMSVTGAVAWFLEQGTAAQAHNVLKTVLLGLIVLHVLAVPFHRIVLKNNVMKRMVRSG